MNNSNFWNKGIRIIDFWITNNSQPSTENQKTRLKDLFYRLMDIFISLMVVLREIFYIWGIVDNNY